jgi:hypothetical protein
MVAEGDMKKNAGTAGVFRRAGVPLLLIVGSILAVTAVVEAVSFVLIKLYQDKTVSRNSGLVVTDPKLGTAAPPNAAIRDEYFKKGKPVFDVTYHTDAHGRRVVPVDAPLERGKFAAFFGCSITFGLGVEDRDTLPACFGRAAPEYMPYNFAYQGYGTQQLYLLMQQPVEQEISQSKGVCVYVYFGGHVMRTIGAMRPVNNWARDYPCFELQAGTETPVCRGTFASAHPWRCMMYGMLGKSQTLQYTGITLPLSPGTDQRRLVAVLIRDSMNMFKAKYPGSQFLVLVHPAHCQRVTTFEWIQPWLDKFKVPYFVCDEDLVRQVPFEKRTVDGGHPAPLANEVVARALAGWLEEHKENP